MKAKLMILLLIFATSIYAQHSMIKISNNLEIIKLSENAYIHISYYDLESTNHFPANGFVYIFEDKAIIVDTPWTNEETRELLDWIIDSLKIEIEAVVVTHWHIDCMGGLEEVNKLKIKSYAYSLTCKIAKQKGLPVPKINFNDKIELGNGKAICRYLGAGHTLDNIVVWLPDEKILFGGCMLKALNWNSLGYLEDADVKEWPITLKKVLKEYPDSQIVIPGHGKYGDLNIVHHTLELLEMNE